MKITAEPIQDIEAALDIAGRDTSPAWLLAAASALEAAARQIRAEVELHRARAAAAVIPALEKSFDAIAAQAEAERLIAHPSNP